MQIPQVTTGRAVGHYVERLDLLGENVAEYYGSLEYSNKPALEDCRIHFSALAPRVAGVCRQSVWLRWPYQSKELDPSDAVNRNMADIIMFVGSFAHNDSFEEMDAVLRGQLDNFAQGHSDDPWLEEGLEASRRQLEAMQGAGDSYQATLVKFVGYSTILAEMFSIGDELTGAAPRPMAAWLAAATATAISQFGMWNRNSLRHMQAESQHARAQREHSRNLGVIQAPLIKVTPAENPPKPLSWSLRPEGHRRPSRSINRRHRQLHQRQRQPAKRVNA